MKTRLLVALAGLAISFVLPTFAQQKETKETVDPKILEQFDAFGKKFDDAFNNKDAAAVAALFTEGCWQNRGRNFMAPVTEKRSKRYSEHSAI